jgi:hypothetical protein
MRSLTPHLSHRRLDLQILLFCSLCSPISILIYLCTDIHMVSLSMCMCNRRLYLCVGPYDQVAQDFEKDPTCSVDSNSMPCVTLTAQQQSDIATYHGPTTTCAAGICNAGYAAPAGGSCTACAPGVLVCKRKLDQSLSSCAL